MGLLYGSRSIERFGLLLCLGGMLAVGVVVLMVLILCASRELPPFERATTVAELRRCEGKPVEVCMRFCTDAELAIPELGVREKALALDFFSWPRVSSLPGSVRLTAGSVYCMDAAGESTDKMAVEMDWRIMRYKLPCDPLSPERIRLPERMQSMLRVLPGEASAVLAERYRNPDEPTTEPQSGDVELRLWYAPSGKTLWARGKVKHGVLRIPCEGWACVREQRQDFPRAVSGRGMHVVKLLLGMGLLAVPVLLPGGLYLARGNGWRLLDGHGFWAVAGLLILFAGGLALAVCMAMWPEYAYPVWVQYGAMAVGIGCAVWSVRCLWRGRREEAA